MPTPYYDHAGITIYHGDCRDVMAGLSEASMDAIVCDPPYGLSFMGKGWDHGVPGVEFWAEAMRVAKPGAHLLAFGGTRTYHRLACAIEDAGWEIRDCVMWVYGSGFPKSLDVSKAIDKNNGEVGRLYKFTEWMRTTGLTARQIDAATDTNMGGHYLTAKSQPAIPTLNLWAKLRPLCVDVPAWVDELVERVEAEREVVGQDTKARSTSGKSAMPTVGGKTVYETWDITAPATDAARQWAGWGTALKPAWEPIIVARKPLDGTVAENLLRHGTGGINVDGCRVEGEKGVPASLSDAGQHGWRTGGDMERKQQQNGRWPANLIHDGSDEVVGLFPSPHGAGCARAGSSDPRMTEAKTWQGPATQDTGKMHRFGDSGSAARFFYCAKASKSDRDEGCEGLEERVCQHEIGQLASVDGRAELKRRNHHPTVKPTDLMRYLCRLVTPPGGVVLDPFMGSGSTGKAARREGFRFVGIELEAEYCAIARARLAQEVLPLTVEPEPVQESLLDGDAD